MIQFRLSTETGEAQGVARWLGGFIVGGLLVIVLIKLGLPGALLILAILCLRFSIWSVLAKFLYEGKTKPVLAFGVIMTVLNAVVDLLLFGVPTLSDLTDPWSFGGLH